MTTVNIRGIPVNFPFEPYGIQKTYMEKVIECLQNEHNGILESPTGTGKTLSLLCSSLAWLTVKKAQIQAQRQAAALQKEINEIQGIPATELNLAAGQSIKESLGVPTIIYASRTHSQLTQAMQELKQSAYSHLKSTVIGSRDQLCINPEVTIEQNHGVKVRYTLCYLITIF